MPDKPGTQSKRWLLLGITVAAGLALLAATQPWVTISLVEGAAAFERLELPGHELNPALSPVAIAALAAALALTIAGRMFRRLLGVIVALLGVGTAAIAFGALGDPLRASTGRIAEATGIAGEGQLGIAAGVEVTAWPSVAVAAGALLVILGLFVLVLGGRWKSGGRKYASQVRKAEQVPEGDRIADWDAQSEGQDPTR